MSFRQLVPLTLVFIGLTCGVVVPAGANPIAGQVLVVRQVPGTRHVQISYVSFNNDVPQWLRRDDHGPFWATWTRFGAYTTNTGSGLQTLPAVQFCDCDVAAGWHTYELRTTLNSIDLSARIEVIKDYTSPVARDGGLVQPVDPWEVPDPVVMQGLNCTTKCVGPPISTKESEGGCSVASGPAGALMLLLGTALLASALLVRLRWH